MRNVILLGATGSIGTQTLEVIDKYPLKYRVYALAAGGSQLALLAQQVERYRPRYVAIANGDITTAAYAQLVNACKTVGAELAYGQAAITAIAGCAPSNSDSVVVNGINGEIGLEATLAALRSGATLALANKESLVVGGPLTKAAMIRPGQIVPVDSEHSAIAQCLLAGHHHRGLTVPVVDGTTDVAALVVTASGGPFRGKTRAQLRDVTLAQALAHPTWSMGPVVTINSSTLANKALEVAEAYLLFDIAPAAIETVVHPQSIVHSMVRFRDGATIAQASPPTMLLPIALGLSWPERLANIAPGCDFSQAQSWEFMPVDTSVFPAIDVMCNCLEASPAHPAVFNAANEYCVQAFRDERIGYLQIIDTVKSVCESFTGAQLTSVADVEAVTEWAQAKASELVQTVA